jgi:hypothetical protein
METHIRTAQGRREWRRGREGGGNIHRTAVNAHMLIHPPIYPISIYISIYHPSVQPYNQSIHPSSTSINGIPPSNPSIHQSTPGRIDVQDRTRVRFCVPPPHAWVQGSDQADPATCIHTQPDGSPTHEGKTRRRKEKVYTKSKIKNGAGGGGQFNPNRPCHIIMHTRSQMGDEHTK